MRHIDDIRVLLSDCSFDNLAINETKLDHTVLTAKFTLTIIQLFVMIVIDMEVVWLFMLKIQYYITPC